MSNSIFWRDIPVNQNEHIKDEGSYYTFKGALITFTSQDKGAAQSYLKANSNKTPVKVMPKNRPKIANSPYSIYKSAPKRKRTLSRFEEIALSY